MRNGAGFALFRGLALGLLGLLLSVVCAQAGTILHDSRLCYQVTPLAAAAASPSTRFACGGIPRGYQKESLWLRFTPATHSLPGTARTLLVHNTRFGTLTVFFRYADGSVETQQVRSGAFGDHWRPGAQIAFSPNNRNAQLADITLRFDRLTSFQLLRMRLLRAGEADVETTILAAVIGAALALLLAGAIYNLSLALAVRRQYLAWQGAWAFAVFLWGAVWSQFGLLVVPGLAGSLAAQAATGLSVLSIPFAARSVTSALGTAMVPRSLRITTCLLSAAVLLIGIPATLVRGPALDQLAPLLGVAVLGTLGSALLCLIWGIRRGSAEARDLLGAWSVPVAALALTQFVDIGGSLWGGGPQILVLFASAWQTIWLSIAASRRLAKLRSERDLARAAEARASQLAERDPLTAIRNRRGFVDASEILVEAAARHGTSLALLLIDVDRFKAINDEFGHDAGDVVLCGIAARLARWEGANCAVARLGGEEFAMLVVDLSGAELISFADQVRQALAECDHRAAIGDQRVTVSIGVTEVHGACDFPQMYREADRALYAAKKSGRNRVRHASHPHAAGPAAQGDAPPAAGSGNQRVG